LFEQFKDNSIVLAGDGRCDSPAGSSAKYCSYSLMEMESHQILHVETVDKRVQHEAFIRSMSYINGKIACSELVSDASSSICKTIGIIIQCVW